MNTRKVPKSSSESRCDDFVPLSLSVAERLRPSPLCSPFASSLGQVRSKAQTQRIDWWPREAQAIWCLHMGACVGPSCKEHGNWVCQAHAHGEFFNLWPCGSPHIAEGKLSSCYPSWCSNQLEKRQICLFHNSCPKQMSKQTWFQKNRGKKRTILFLKGRRMVRIAIPWTFHSQIL